ncbi:MAG: hypothetical protein QG577_1996 [Thermodesulfobacteriota bacterium]|nr:hypothetical protein [Thermodesulfobacteriota bacterium]
MTMKSNKGFSYYVSQEQINDYRNWPLERRLKWLLLSNKMRKLLGSKTVELHDAFRSGKI